MYLSIKRIMIAGFAFTAMLVVACTAENKSPPNTTVQTDSSENALEAPQSTQLSKEALQALGEEIASWVESGDPVGAEILVAQHGDTVFHEVYGWDDREEGRLLERNSVFRLRSMTKPIVGTAVLMLAEDGKLGLDDTVAQYLPSFENDRSRSITIRQLLTHTSGLGGAGWNDIALSKSRATGYESLRALVDEIGEIGPAAAGGDFHYSDSGSSTLGAIVAEVSGMPAEQFIQERILQPLGMRDTYSRFEPDAPWAKRMNSTYQQSQGSCDFEKYWDRSMAQTFKYFRASGGLYSTTGDYMRFLVDVDESRGTCRQAAIVGGNGRRRAYPLHRCGVRHALENWCVTHDEWLAGRVWPWWIRWHACHGLSRTGYHCSFLHSIATQPCPRALQGGARRR